MFSYFLKTSLDLAVNRVVIHSVYFASNTVVLATVLCYGTVHVLILALAQGEPNHIIVTRVVELLREIATFVVKDSVSDNLM